VRRLAAPLAAGTALALGARTVYRLLADGAPSSSKLRSTAAQAVPMTSQGTAYGRFARAVQRGNIFQAQLAAGEMGSLSLADALSLCEMLAAPDPQRFERAARRWLQRFIEERSPSLPEVALAAGALSEMRHGRRGVGVETCAG
jgi:hypothetical protein